MSQNAADVDQREPSMPTIDEMFEKVPSPLFRYSWLAP